MDVGATKFGLWRVDAALLLRLVSSAPRSRPTVFFLHAEGSAHGMFPRTPDSKDNWRPVRAFVTGGSSQPGPFGRRATCLVFEREPVKQRVNFFTMSDFVIPWDERVSRERLYIALLCNDRSFELDPKTLARPDTFGRHVFLPMRPGPLRLQDAIFVHADRAATVFIGNLRVQIHPNFSDVRSSSEFEQGPKQATEPMKAALCIRNFLTRPVPSAEHILHHDGVLISAFGMAKTAVRKGEQTELRLAFGLDALRQPDVVRLTVPSGSFHRDGRRVLYQAAQTGKHTIGIEVISGTHWNGRTDYAERATAEIRVVGEE